jgi:hypothetical protein
VGRDYTVLEVFAAADGRNLYRIEVYREQLPPLFDSRLFEIVDGSIPSHWTVSAGVQGDVTLGPKKWEAPGFWDAFIEGETWAVSLYEAERDLSLQ